MVLSISPVISISLRVEAADQFSGCWTNDVNPKNFTCICLQLLYKSLSRIWMQWHDPFAGKVDTILIWTSYFTSLFFVKPQQLQLLVGVDRCRSQVQFRQQHDFKSIGPLLHPYGGSVSQHLYRRYRLAHRCLEQISWLIDLWSIHDPIQTDFTDTFKVWNTSDW